MGGERGVPVTQRIQQVLGPHGCSNTRAECEEWAATGECERNHVFMVGTRLQPGACLLACNECEMLAHGAEGLHLRKSGTQ